ncbi:MAG: nucleotidyltransferase family protein [Acidobacteriota bacterium]|nr:nucleotidyltransferase family protein [Acidobacteriota bacterium]
MTKVQAERIRRAFVFFRQNEIEPILIKGWAIARFYPNPTERFSADVDLAVNPDVYPKALELTDRYLRGKLTVDLHCGLGQFDQIPFEDLFENSQFIEINDIKARVLRHEDHLRLLAVHWLRDGGIFKQRLWDLHYGVKNRPTDFDWNRFLGVADEKRRKWIIAAIALAHRHTNLNVEDTPIAEEIKNPSLIPKWMSKTLEKEWNDPVQFIPLDAVMHDRKEFWRQLKKRFPPNPLVASFYTNAPLNDFPRLPYQIINMLQRLKPSIERGKIKLRWMLKKS